MNDNSEGKEINIYINEVSKDCKIKFTASEEMNGSFEMYYNQNNNEFYFQCGIVDLKEKEGIYSFNIDSVTNVKGNFKYKEHHTLLNKDIYKLYLSSSSYEFKYYGADYIDRPYVGWNNYYVSQTVKSFTLYYVDSYIDTNTFLNNIYPSKDSTTALTNCSLIKLDYYF